MVPKANPLRSMRAKVALPEGMANHFVSEPQAQLLFSHMVCECYACMHLHFLQFIRLVEKSCLSLSWALFLMQLRPFSSHSQSSGGDQGERLANGHTNGLEAYHS